MIDIAKEQLIPVINVPAYLEPRRLGKRVYANAFYRWTIALVQCARLESVHTGSLPVLDAVVASPLPVGVAPLA